jgi:hypothetical protein
MSGAGLTRRWRLLLRAPLAACGALVLIALLSFASTAKAHVYVATVTLAEGPASLVSEAKAYRPAPGVWLHHCDIVATGAKGFVQLEIDDGGMVELGPLTRFVAHLPALHRQAPLVGPHYLLQGWAKVTVPKRPKGLRHRVDTPLLSVVIDQGIVVLQVAADKVRFFVESGTVTALGRERGSQLRTVVRAGSMYSIQKGLDRGAMAGRIAPDFVKAMPPAFRDTLRPRLASLKVRNVAAKPAGDDGVADAVSWLDSDVEIRQACARRH